MALYILMAVSALIMLFIEPKMGIYVCILAAFTAFLQWRKFKTREQEAKSGSSKKSKANKKPHKKH